ncbi:MAG TPA: YraN family protein [Rhodanobacteraceae bacterium]|nr:YraN family protein [Rhodanobacteraceae bacterium]
MRAIGDGFEARALALLQRASLVLLERNYLTRYGEIDLVMRDGDCVVFVEVRYRGSPAQGGAAASIGVAKRGRLGRAAALYLQAHPALADRPCRFDVVAFDGTAASVPAQWLQHAFETDATT